MFLNTELLAIDGNRESCGGACERTPEALTVEYVGWVLCLETVFVLDADRVGVLGRQQFTTRFGERCEHPARSETPCMHRDFLRENREMLRVRAICTLANRIDDKSKDVS